MARLKVKGERPGWREQFRDELKFTPGCRVDALAAAPDVIFWGINFEVDTFEPFIHSCADKMVKFIDDFPDAKESNGEATELSTHRIDEDEEVNGTRNAGFIEGEGHKKKR
jgi:hypothetical protein